ncbi:MAG TPA: hypothetical protein GXX55_01605 [Firmicutes bacterium]|nr:hypothetical protein [Bacillota bacterium]
MKLVLTVVQNQDVGLVLEKLLAKGLRATKLASTGGFLRQGNTTLLVGVQDERVPEVIEILRAVCGPRTGAAVATTGPPLSREGERSVASPADLSPGSPGAAPPRPGGTIAFVLDVVRFDRV